MKAHTLTKENIEFIDNYLQKEDVFFVDIRAELTDHIAASVEEKMNSNDIEFYYAFKDFMVENKKEILKSNSNNFKHFRNANSVFLKTLYKPYNLIFGLFLIVTFRFYVDAKLLNTIHKGIFFLICGILLFQVLYSYLILRKRYLCIENTSYAFMGIYYFNFIFNGFFEDFKGSSFTIVVTIFLLFSFITYTISIVTKFRLRYLLVK